MRRLLNWRVFFMVIWLLITFVAFSTMPDLSQLARDKGDLELPSNFESLIASNLIKEEMNSEEDDVYDLIVVFNNENEEAFTETQWNEIDGVIQSLESEEDKLNIISITSPLEDSEVADQLVTEDDSAAILQLAVSQTYGTIDEVKDAVTPVLEADGVDTYLTGGDLISEDFSKTTEEGIKITEIIAVIFIIVVLVVIFRSPIVPLVSLFTVGISYLISITIIALSVQHFDFAYSSFTQIFLIIILFGVGTDYNILLYTRFREELSHQKDVQTAVKETIRVSGKTVIYSGIAVLIGFATLGLVEFSFYKSMAAIAVGVAVLVLVLITLNPFFMDLLGRKMYWPSKSFEGHSDSRIWGFLASRSVLRPIITLLIAAICIVPFIWLYNGDLHYNDLYEIGDEYESKQGILIIQDKFPSGLSSPASVLIKSGTPLDNEEMLKAIDDLTGAIAQVDGVDEVLSPTRPTGEKIKELYINDQTNSVGSGIGDANGGTQDIQEGLSEAEQQLANNDGSSGLESVQQLIDGTSEARGGTLALQDAISQISTGVSEGADGAGDLEAGLNSLLVNLESVSSATSDLSTGYNQIEVGLTEFSNSFSTTASSIEGSLQTVSALLAELEGFLAEYPEIASDPAVAEALEAARNGGAQINELSNSLGGTSEILEQALVAFREANGSLEQVTESINQIRAGADELVVGAQELQGGLQDGAEGADLIGLEAGQLGSGLSEIQSGQEQLQSSLITLQEQMSELQEGLLASTEGLDEISTGLTDAESFLGEVSESESAESFFVPEEVLNGEEFQEALDAYLSNDRDTAQLTIILDVDPYSTEAMVVVRDIQDQISSVIKGTSLEEATIAVGGQSSNSADLNDISSRDFALVATVMLLGIGLFLIIISRSITLPIFIIGLLTLAYYTSLSITEMLSSTLFGVDEIGWNVPFFGFILLVAIGVDYSIFLLMRYRELKGDALSSIVTASLNIGGVIISAAIILGGTFAALYPSGVLTLMQVATVVVVGLALLSLLMLPAMLPALMSVTKKISQWAQRKEE